MKTSLNVTNIAATMPLLLAAIFLFFIHGSAYATTFPLSVTGTGSGNIIITGDAGTTNLTDNSATNKTPSITLLSRTAPTASSTRMQISVAKNTTSELGRMYYNYNNNTGFGSAVDISAKITFRVACLAHHIDFPRVILARGRYLMPNQ
jgi:hypothetical protein